MFIDADSAVLSDDSGAVSGDQSDYAHESAEDFHSFMLENGAIEAMPSAAVIPAADAIALFTEKFRLA